MFLTPFLIGLAGSIHCIGMCNPLVMAVSGTGKKAVYRNLTYNAGRILTYGLLGAIVSFVGLGLSIAGLQHGVSVVTGIVILIVGIANIRVAAPSFVNQRLIRLVGMIKMKFQLNTLLMGMVNGLIPCGMTLVALGYCVTLEWPADGFIAMASFGLGTMPAMFGISSILKKAVSMLSISYRSIQTTLLILSGIILIGRGALNYDAHPAHKTEEGIVVCGDNSGK
jgi:sulfite exporter TauE/SafE